jgi:hypothetical protein
MRELGFVVRWGRVVPGRELEAVDLFAETTKYYGDLLAKGELTFFEPFMYLSGDNEIDNGFFVLKGPAQKINEIFESEETLSLKTKGALLLSHLSTELILVGEDVLGQVTRFADTSKAVGKIPVGVA